MADQPGAQQPAVQQPTAPPRPPESQSSIDDYNNQLRASLSQDSTPPAAGSQPAQPPVRSYGRRLLHSLAMFFDPKSLTSPTPEEKQQMTDFLNAPGRGAAGAVNQLARTATSAGHFLVAHVPFGKAFLQYWANPGTSAEDILNAKKSPDELNHMAFTEDQITKAFGPPSDDPIANFTESATQFAAGMALTAGAGAELKGAQAFGAFLLRGAVADATTFDPYQAQLAELLAKTPVPGIRQVGQLLSVTGDDSELVARIKRSVGGALASAVVDGLVASARWIRSGRILASSTATQAQKAAAQPVAADAQATLQNVANVEHTGVGDQVVVRQTPEGYQLQTAPNSPLANPALAERRAVAQDASQTPLLERRVSQNLETPAHLRRSAELGQPPRGVPVASQPDLSSVGTPRPLTTADYAGTGVEPPSNIPSPLTGTTESPAEHAANAAFIQQLQDQGLLTPEEAQPAIAARQTLAGPTFQSRANAEVAASNINSTLHEASVGMTPAMEAQHRELAKELLDSGNPDAVAAAAEKTGSNFNLSLYTTQPEVQAQIEAMSRTIRSVIDEAQGRPGGVPVEQSIKAARTALGGMTEAEVPAALRGKMGSLTDQHIWLLAGDMYLRRLGTKVSELSDRLAANPADIGLHEEARVALQQLYDTGAMMGGANSEIGRALNIRKATALPAATAPLKFRPDVAARVTAAGSVARKALDDLQAAITAEGEKPKISANDTANPAVNAADFSLARARNKAQAAMDALEKADPTFVHSPAAASKRGQEVLTAADAQRAAPLAQPEGPIPTQGPPKNPIEEMSRWMDQANSQLDRQMARARGEVTRPTPEAPSSFSASQDARQTPLAILRQNAENAPPQITAGMSHAEVRAAARMVKMAGGAPNNVYAIVRGATVVARNTGVKGIIDKAFEVFANSLLSGPVTAQVIVGTGAILNTAEGFIRAVAGAATLNPALAREGVDVLFGNLAVLGDGIKATAASFRADRSIIAPIPQHMAIGGLTGTVIRVPGRILGSLHEGVRVVGYRALVRAKSLRLGRTEGLTGDALAARVAEDLNNAFDKQTGIAVLPEALQYAQQNTLTNPLGRGTIGGDIQSVLQDHPLLRFIAPFQKISTNIIRYTWKSSPGLNLINDEWRQIALGRRGAEEAAILHTRSVLATSLMGYGLYQAALGNLTGRGPSNPTIRKEWLRDNQPYSFRFGPNGEWHSYERFEPLSSFLGLTADTHQVWNELGANHPDASDMLYGVFAGLLHNLSTKSYLTGVTEFADSWSSNDPSENANATGRWINSFAGSLVPQAAYKLNPDSVVRDVRSMADAIMSRTPGLSETVDPRYDWSGEPILKTPGFWNRQFVSPTQPHTRSVETDLLTLNKGLSPANPTLVNGLIDLRDKNAYDNGTHVSPWNRLNQLIAHPKNGVKSARAAMEELVRSQAWRNSSDGTELFPGGSRWLRAAGKLEEYQQKALRQVMLEYPKLSAQYRGLLRVQGASIQSGEQGAAAVQQRFNVQLP